MKKFLFLSVAILAFVLGSCSKEAKLNRKLDGKWEITTVNSVAVPAADAYTITFTKDKKGKGAVVYAQGAFSMTGTYVLTDDTSITVTMDGSADKTVVKEYSKDKLVLVDGTTTSEFKKL